MSLVRSLVGGNLEGFRTEFESFLDRCQSFVGCVGIGHFLPVFFFSMFATAHDAGILRADEKVYFRFDNHGVNPRTGRNRNTGNLKVAVLTRNLDEQQVVRCYSISNHPYSGGLRFSTREKSALVREIRRQNPDLREEDLSFKQYKVCMHGKGRSQGEAIATVFEIIREKDFGGRDKFAKYSASEINLLRQFPGIGHRLSIKSIERRRLERNQREQLNRLINFVQVEPVQQEIDNFAEMLTSERLEYVEDSLVQDILPYITDTYYKYIGDLEGNIANRNQEFEGHGFLLGFLANFSHLHTIDIDLDLSIGNSYVAFLVRHQAERDNIPIIINLSTGDADDALSKARGYAQRLHASSFISIHTESRYAVCIELNFNLNIDPFSVDTVEFLENRFPLVQRLFEYIEDEEVGENIRDFLLYHLPGEIPMNAENYNRILDCITGFSFGSSILEEFRLVNAVQQRVRKYIFRHNDEDLREYVSNMVFHTQGSDIVILHIRAHDAQQQGDIDLQTLNVNGDNVHVWEVSCTLNDDSLELDIDLPNDLGLYHDYQNNNANNFLDGDLVQVPNAENVHNALNQVMNDGWQNRDQHRELLRAISRVLMPGNMQGNTIVDVSSNDKFRSMLHGIFYACDNPDKVITGYKVGQTYSPVIEGEVVEQVNTRVAERRLGLLLLRRPAADTHPIGYVLGFADNAEEVEREQDEARYKITELMSKQRGYLPITSGNEVVLSYAVFNRGAQRAEELITIQQLYVHRLNRGNALRRVEQRQPVRLVEPEGIIDESPPANLLSDVIILNFSNYRQNVRQEDQRKEKILFFQQGDNDNQCIEVHLHECSKEDAIRRRIRSSAHGTIPTTQTVQDILTQIRGILDNQQIEVSDLLTLEFATSTGYYDYWLQQIDIARAGRLRYQLRTEGNHTFEVANLTRNDGKEHIVRVLNQFGKNEEQQRLTFIITLNNTHWVTLVIERQNGNYVGYYADSNATAIPGGITDIVRNNLGNNVRIENVSVHQQTDGHNCGLWALENASDINLILNDNPEGRQGIVNIIRNFLGRDYPHRDENYFQNLRGGISQLFRDNPHDGVQLQAYHDNRGRIDPLLRTYLELGYHRVGGGYGLGEAPIWLSVSDFSNFSDLPRSISEDPEASRVSNLSKGKGGR